jgi:hypothetical protein
MKQASFDMIVINIVERFGKSFSARFTKSRYKLSNKLISFLDQTPNSPLLLFLLLLAMRSAAAQTDISALMTAVQPIAYIGQAIDLVVIVEHPAGYRVIAPQLEPAWGDFEVRQQSALQVAAAGDGRERSLLTITVMAWALGEFATPSLPLTVSNPQGELLEVMAAPVTIRVESVLTDDDLALRDIKPQAVLPLPLWWPWLALPAGLALLALFWWRTQGRETVVPFSDNRLPYQIALAELDEIAASGLAERGDFKGHYTQMIDVLRRYIDRTMGQMTLEQTTAEIRRAIQPLSWPTETKKLLLTLLNEADLVKFAKVRPTVADAQRATSQARQLLLALKETFPTGKSTHA